MSSNRIITMQSVYVKPLEQIVAWKIFELLEGENILPVILRSYTQTKMTWENSGTSAHGVLQEFQNEMKTVGAALVIKDAYNSIDYASWISCLASV